MKELILRTGIIGTIYVRALGVAVVDVTHFVGKGKSGKFKNGVQIYNKHYQKDKPLIQYT
jgi:hypothetical protein